MKMHFKDRLENLIPTIYGIFLNKMEFNYIRISNIYIEIDYTIEGRELDK
jgi:hypothetical protein